MKILNLLSTLKDSGITLQLEQENLKINSPKGKLTPNLVNQLKIHKKEIVQLLKGMSTRQEYKSIEPIEKREYYDLTPAQKRLYFLQQFDIESTSYNIPYIIPWKTIFEIKQLENIFEQLINRHESFRTSFEIVQEQPIQRIHDRVDFQIQRFYINENENLAKETIIKEFIKPFDLTQPPLLRVGLIEIKQETSVLLIDMHHIISDGTSEDILTGEFIELNQGNWLSHIRLQYKDYSVWLNSPQQKEIQKKQQSYWLNQLSGELPILSLPTDYNRPLLQSFEGNTLQITLDEILTKSIKQIAQTEDVTLYMVILSLFTILLHKLSNKEDVIIGTPVNGRLHPDIEKSIGMFVNTLPIRNYPLGYKTVQEFLKEIKIQTLNAFENQEFQFDELVELLDIPRDTSRNPIFDVMFNFLEQGENPQGTLTTADNTDEELLYKNSTSKFDLTLTAMDRGNKLIIEMEYCKRLFNHDTILRFLQYFKRLVKLLPKTDRKISEIQLISEDEKKQQLFDFNQTYAEIPNFKTVTQLYMEQVARTPDNSAIVGQNVIGTPAERNSRLDQTTLTYKELNNKVEEVAILLQSKGIQPESIVGLIMERSLEMVIGILGILRAGGAYLPISPDFPEERIHYILNDSNAWAVLVVTQSHLKIKLNSEKSMQHSQEKPIQIIEFNSSSLLNRSQIPELSTIKNPAIIPATDQMMYIIYTSGSTGKPKGVLVNNRSVVNLLWSLNQKYPLKQPDAFLFKTPIVFDVSVPELFGWFIGGGKLVALNKNGEKDPEIILESIALNGITHVNFVPSMFNAFINILNPLNTKLLSSLKFIFLAGEAVWPELISTFNSYSLNIYLENLYGPTEASVYASGHSMCNWEPGKRIYIGKPLNNTQLYIIGNNNLIQPLGVNGELCIAGKGLALGYLNNQLLTNEKFISHPFIKNERMYLTGDLARWSDEGNIEFLGRKDRQIKIRGFRIELGEIENQLLSHREIKEAVVVAKDAPGMKSSSNKDKYLCAYIVSNEEIDINNVKSHISQKLPEYMIPTYFIRLEQIPQTPNGKLDRNSLPEPELININEYVSPNNTIEAKLVEIWSEVLGHKKEIISVEGNFFQLGGQSLRATVITSKIFKELNIKISIDQLFKAPTIRGLAQIIKNQEGENYTSIKPSEEKEYHLLSSSQKRIYTLQHLDCDSTAYNLPNITLMEKIDNSKIENAIKKLIDRHTTLRTSFVMHNDEPIQKIHPSVEFKIEYHEKEPTIEPAIKIRDFIRPFDLSYPSLLRVGVFVIDDTHILFMTDIHHIIADGTSVEILTREFLDIYNSKILPKLYIQFKDYLHWESSPLTQPIIKQQETYWLNEFSGNLPVLNMPIDNERPPVQSFVGSSFQFTLKKKESIELKNIATNENCTLYMVLFSIYNILLSKLSGQEDIIVGMVSGGRRHPNLQNIIGMFVNTLAIRTFPQADKTFKKLLQEVKQKVIFAYENQDYPLEDLVEKVVLTKNRDRNPLFDTVFNSREANLEINNNDKGNSSRIKASPFQFESKTTKFDIAFFCGEAGEEIILSMDYSTKLFKKETIERFSTYFKEIIDIVTNNNSIELKDITISHHLLRAQAIQPEMDLDI